MFLVVIVGCEKPQLPTRQYLHEGWRFSQEGKNEWKSATVPGVVHTDLLSHQLIPHPWKGTNELEVQWIEIENWEYQTSFNISKEQLERDAIDLVFEGLDTYAEVTLNNQLILSTDNMFRTWRKNVTDLILEGKNLLEIKFTSPIEINAPKLDALGYELPAGSETVERKVSPFTRKAPYHFGWDWGPRLVTSGVWRPVYLDVYDVARLDDVQIITHELTEENAKLEAVLTVNVLSSNEFEFHAWDQREQYKLEPGEHLIRIPFEINNPERWWPNGWGDPYLYEIPVSMSIGGNEIDGRKVKIGLREVELIQDEDSIGRSFYFEINGEPLFTRGANYIPQSHFLPSVQPVDYEKLIEEVKASGMNMLRVWGGGIYENDLFYDLCDENGILVWQDFMFAGSMYPGDSTFIKNVEAEVIDNVKRLRNHPSIVHWNGNNEIDVAWNNWGWQAQYGYSEEDSTKIWKDYLFLFHDLIPDLLSTLDDRPYTTTSPLSNWGTPENFNYSSMHYWGVWHGGDDFEAYDNNVGRFMSEYGFQSFPAIETIAFFADSSQWDLGSEVMKHHQKSYVGNGMISKNIEKYFNEPTDFKDFVLKSQQTQAKAMQMAIDAHRLKKDHCWGSLFWQLNDCWPGPSWSAVDVFGRKKVFYDELSTLFAPIALIPKFQENDLVISLVNDSLEAIEGEMILTLMNVNGNLQKESRKVSCRKNGVTEVFKEKITADVVSGRLELILNGVQIFERQFVR